VDDIKGEALRESLRFHTRLARNISINCEPMRKINIASVNALIIIPISVEQQVFQQVEKVLPSVNYALFVGLHNWFNNGVNIQIFKLNERNTCNPLFFN